MAFKIVISNREKTFQKEIKDEQARALLGMKIGNVFDGRVVGEKGQLRITGGSDKEGFPMRKDVDGTRRLLLLLDDAPGFHPTSKGERRKKRVRGNTISEAIVQINTVVVEEKKEERKIVEPKKKEKPKAAEIVAEIIAVEGVAEPMAEEKGLEHLPEVEHISESDAEKEKKEAKPAKKPAKKKGEQEKKKITPKKAAPKKKPVSKK
jgi:small subunit ribosomal protein S6e